MANDVDIVGIDEAQFFDDEIINVCETLALRGIRVIVAGLDMDYRAGHLAKCQAVGHCRFHYQTACYLCEVRTSCKYFVPKNRRRRTGIIGRKGCL